MSDWSELISKAMMTGKPVHVCTIRAYSRGDRDFAAKYLQADRMGVQINGTKELRYSEQKALGFAS